MKLISLLLIATSYLGYSNPIAIGKLEKRWERCVISAGDISSTVSCAVGYKVLEHPSYGFQFSVPIILPKNVNQDENFIRGLVKARLEVAGNLITPTKIIVFDDRPKLPNGAIWARAYFDAPNIKDELFSIVVSYEQPTIDGLIMYSPQFEEGKNPKNLSEFTVSIFPNDGGLLSLQSKHKGKQVVLSTRITITPLHDENIIVKYKKSEQDAPSNH